MISWGVAISRFELAFVYICGLLYVCLGVSSNIIAWEANCEAHIAIVFLVEAHDRKAIEKQLFRIMMYDGW